MVTALFAGISGLPLEKAVLVMGQVLNAAISLSIYALGRVVWSDPRRAAVAALLSAFVSQMPAYYATWGRYTLISGLVLLPLAMAALLENRDSDRDLFKIIFQMILVAGTVLAHYFAGFLLLLFVLVFFGEGIGWAFAGKGRWDRVLLAPLAGLLGGLLLIVPWLLDYPEFGRKIRRADASPLRAANGPNLFPGLCGVSFPSARSLEKLFLVGRGAVGVFLGSPGCAPAGRNSLGSYLGSGDPFLGISSFSLSSGPFCHRFVFAGLPDSLSRGV